MANNCDSIFQEIQELERQKRALQESRDTLQSISRESGEMSPEDQAREIWDSQPNRAFAWSELSEADQKSRVDFYREQGLIIDPPPTGKNAAQSDVDLEPSMKEAKRLWNSNENKPRPWDELSAAQRRAAVAQFQESGQIKAETAAKESQQAAPRPPLEIPDQAVRPLTPTSEKVSAQALFDWANAGLPTAVKPFKSVGEALEVLRANGNSIDLRKLDVKAEQVRAERRAGKKTPAVQRVAQAYRKFYGIPEPEVPKPVKPQAPVKPGEAARPEVASVGEGSVPLDASTGTQPVSPKRFTLTDKTTGRILEADLAELDPLIRAMDDEGLTRLIAGRVGIGMRPDGSKGQFANYAQLVDRLGIESATDAGILIEAITGRWQALDPADFQRVTAINDKAAVAERLAKSYAEAGIRIEANKLVEGIVQNAAPFMRILDNQAKLTTFEIVTRRNLVEAIRMITKEVEATGMSAGEGVMSNFADASRKAVLAQRGSVIARRTSGQLLQQLKVDAYAEAPRLVADQFRAQMAEEMAELFGDTAPDLAEDSLVAQVAQAATLGPDGLKELKALESTVAREGVGGGTSLDKGWKDGWKRDARGYYKDSILFNIDTQAISNFLSNKAVYWREGYEKAWENAFLLPNVGTPELLGFLGKAWEGRRVALNAGFLAEEMVARVTADALDEAVAASPIGRYGQKWKQVWQEGILKGRNPFADTSASAEIDINTGRSLSNQREYDIANRVLFGVDAMPEYGDGFWERIGSATTQAADVFSRNPAELPFILRDRIHLGFSIIGNFFIEKGMAKAAKAFGQQAPDIELPLTGALRGLAATDSRIGMKTYLSLRANDLLMRTFKDEPRLRRKGGDGEGMSWDERMDVVRGQLENELYTSTPTDAQVASYREQFDVDMEAMTDQQIREDIASRLMGTPVLDRQERLDALEFSKYTRMQLPPDVPGFKGFNKFVMEARENSYVDSFLSFWQSPAAGTFYVLGDVLPTKAVGKWFDNRKLNAAMKDTSELVFGDQSAKSIARVKAAWVTYATTLGAFIGLYKGFKAVKGMGPSGGNQSEREQWRMRNESNSIFGVSRFSQVPILSVFMTMADIADGVEAGLISDYDGKDAFIAGFQAYAGQLFRAAGFGQFRRLQAVVMAQGPNAGEKFADFMGYWANGQFNPASGVMRQMEKGGSGFGLGGFGKYDRWQGPAPNLEDLEVQGKIDDAPTHSIYERLRGIADKFNPLLGDRPIQRKDYLGRDLRTPAGWFQGEWPTGWPGQYKASVHDTLLSLRMLRPPSALREGRLDGVPMSTDLMEEYNNELGSITPPPGESIATHPAFNKSLTFKVPYVQEEDPSLPLGPSRTKRANGKSYHELLDRVTSGATLHEALNRLFSSEEWKAWQRDPELTNLPSQSSDPRAADTRPENLGIKRPGGWAVDKIHKYYDHLTANRIRQSDSPAAATWRDWRDSRRRLTGGPEKVIRLQDKLQGISDSAGAPAGQPDPFAFPVGIGSE